MPNSLVATGLTQLSGAFVAALYDSGVLANTVWRDAESSLIVGRGDSVTIREPAMIDAALFTGTAAVSNITEAKYVISVNSQPYSQVMLTAKEKTLSIEDLATQVVVPQAAGIAEHIDEAIATKLEATTGTAGATTAAGWTAAVLNAREVLSGYSVPLAGRWLAVAPDVASLLLNSTIFTTGNVNNAGNALAEGTLGRLYGFNVVESNSITAATAVAYHSTAVAAIFRTPQPPEGGAASGSVAFNGLSAQTIYSYDSTKLADVLTCQTLYGLGTSTTTFAKRALKVTLT